MGGEGYSELIKIWERQLKMALSNARGYAEELRYTNIVEAIENIEEEYFNDDDDEDTLPMKPHHHPSHPQQGGNGLGE